MNSTANQMDVWEQKYHDITALYGMAEELLATVETSANPEMQLGLVEKLVETIGESADVLSEEYIGLCQHGTAHHKAAKPKIESALRKLYSAIGDFSLRARDVRNTAYQVLGRLKQQLEKVIVNFAEMIALSIDRIMQKHDVEALKARHRSLSLLLFTKSQGQAT